MITLQDNKDYYIIIDNEAGWNSGCIFEGKEEVFETFQTYADIDEINIKKYTFADCMDTWNMEIKKYNGRDFEELTRGELNTTQ